MPFALHLHIDTREPFADGQAFGDAGAYERIAGRAEVFLDPDSPHYAQVTDLALAPRDDAGRVRYETDFYLLKPVDMARGNRRLFYDVVNRGDKRALMFFNDAAATNDPASEADAGNGFLFRQGYSVLWCGWQADVLPGGGRSTLDVPIARDGGKAITGRVREEIIIDAAGVVTSPLSNSAVTRSHPAAAPDTGTATLTCREYEGDARQPVAEWEFARVGVDGAVEPSSTDIYLPGGFKPGWIYEALYTATDPQVLGLGFAAVRDLVDFLRHDGADADGTANPLASADGQPAIEKAYAWGRSQSGRYLRAFVYDGWNEGCGGRRVFDAVWPHVTGAGRLAMNVRFGHPDRFPRQHEAHLYPSDQFPFAYVETMDPFSGRTDAILKRPATDPLVFHTQTASEYWQRRGSLVHTDAGGADLPDHPNVRLYSYASSQHHAAPGVPPQPGGPHQNLSNPLNTSALNRALLVQLDRWATDGIAPPPSQVPRLSDGTLIPAQEVQGRFPKIGDVRVPHEANRLFPHDFGPDYAQGIVSEPPTLNLDHEYEARVPVIDADGNEVPGLRTPDVSVPRATYCGWNMRADGFAPDEMYSILGSYLPFAAMEAERQAQGDARPSLAERYASPGDYVRQVEDAATALRDRGFLLDEDVARYIAAARQVKF